MDTTTAGVIIVAIFALVILVAFLRFRQSGNAEIKGPFGINLNVKGDNPAPPEKRAAIKAEGITSREGGVLAEDSTGGGLDVKNIKAKEDVLLSSSAAPQDGGPKARPPK